MRLHTISATVVEMWNGRDLIEFTSTGNGIYTDGNGLSLSSSGDGNEMINTRSIILVYIVHCYPVHTVILFEATKLGAQYTFESSSGQLRMISAGFEDHNITVQYLNQTYPKLLTHSNGRQLRITYNEDKIIYIDLVDTDNRILKSW